MKHRCAYFSLDLIKLLAAGPAYPPSFTEYMYSLAAKCGDASLPFGIRYAC